MGGIARNGKNVDISAPYWGESPSFWSIPHSVRADPVGWKLSSRTGIILSGQQADQKRSIHKKNVIVMGHANIALLHPNVQTEITKNYMIKVW